MVRSIVTAYLWLAALWSLGAVLHELTGLPEGVGLVAGLLVAGWLLRPVVLRVLRADPSGSIRRAARPAELVVPAERPLP